LLLLVACAPGLPRFTPVPNSPTLEARLAPARRTLDSAIAAGAAPGAVLAVSVHGERFLYATGRMGVHDASPPTPSTLYDMASLTKVIALTTLAMMAVEEQKLDLDAPVVRYLPDFARGLGEKSAVTVRDLLLHDSGLPADRRLWEETVVRKGAVLRTITTDLDTVPGTHYVYSDLGAITLMAIIERLYHERIDKLFAERIAKPMGFTRMRYRPPKGWRPEIAPTEVDKWRGKEMRGEVHDENAWWMNGVSGHAGLFSDAPDLLTFGEWALTGRLGKPWAGPLQPPPEFRTWTVRQDRPEGSSRAIGWDTPSGISSSGTIMSASSFGHTGFTGTSIWIDPDRQVVIVLLTNRVNPTRNTPKFGNIRGAVADAVMRSLFPDAPLRSRR
jgi:CubicO group peptidase (beta-lactamase class C family)